MRDVRPFSVKAGLNVACGFRNTKKIEGVKCIELNKSERTGIPEEAFVIRYEVLEVEKLKGYRV